MRVDGRVRTDHTPFTPLPLGYNKRPHRTAVVRDDVPGTGEEAPIKLGLC